MWRGGIEEWPPVRSTVRCTPMEPFSTTPIRAMGRLTPGHQSFGDHPALVDQEGQFAGAFLQDRRQAGRSRKAAQLFVVAKGQVDGAAGFEALTHQPFHGLEDRDDRRLVIEGAAPPDESFGGVSRQTAGVSSGTPFRLPPGTTSRWPMSRIGSSVVSDPVQV